MKIIRIAALILLTWLFVSASCIEQQESVEQPTEQEPQAGNLPRWRQEKPIPAISLHLRTDPDCRGENDNPLRSDSYSRGAVETLGRHGPTRR